MEERTVERCTSATVPVHKVAALFRCSRCLKAPLKPPVSSCRSGHLTCSSCYRGPSDNCKTCKEPFLGRNEVLEEVLRELPVHTCRALEDCCRHLHESKSEQSFRYCPTTTWDSTHLDQLEQARLEAEKTDKHGPMGDCFDTNNTIESSPAPSYSHLCLTPSYRPALCPYNCGRIVTYSSLYPHFELHHPQVRVVAGDLETEHQVEFFFQDVLLEGPHCGAFHLVRLREGKGIVDDNNSWMKPANLLKVTKSSEMLRKGVLMATLSASRLYLPTGSEEDEDDDCWFMAIWATCLYKKSPLSYTVKVSKGGYCVAYTGGLVPLHESQDPREVCAKGQCLLLTPGLLKQANFGPEALKVYITFHMDSPYTPTLGHHLSQTSSGDHDFSSASGS